MATYNNIEKSGFRAGEYVGYAGGIVYSIKRNGKRSWRSTKSAISGKGQLIIDAANLAQMSRKLDAV